MDKRKVILNVSVSVFFKIITMITAILVKRLLIQYCGNEVNGLNALYLSIIGMLTVTELGVGTAVSFCMYRPIVEGDDNKVSALYHLLQKFYIFVGAVILLVGLLLTPYLKYFAKDYIEIDVNLYVTFVLMLVSSIITYLFGAKTALINAYKNNYITSAIGSLGLLFQYGLQIITLLKYKSFIWYLSCRIISAIVQWIATNVVAQKRYLPILRNKQNIDKNTKRELTRNIKGLFMHKIGGLLVNTVDSVIISGFVGVIALGEYSNYTMILNNVSGILDLVFSSLTSILGHLYVGRHKKTVIQYSYVFHLFNFVLGTVFFLGYYSIVDNLIAILFSDQLIVEKSISFVITLNGFIQFQRRSTLTFKDAAGIFYNDRWKPLLEGVTNIILSIVFVKRIGVVGVIAATILTNLVICHVIEPYVLYRNAFCVSPKYYYLKNYGMIGFFILALWILDNCMQSINNEWMELLVNGCISVIVSAITCVAVSFLNKNTVKVILQVIKEK